MRQKTIDRLRDFDSNAKIYSCMELLRLNISELELLKYLKQINFGKSLENYHFINE